MILTIALTAGMITGCAGKQEESEQTQKENYVTATLFCDVNHWNPPAWDLSEDSITGKITKKTGVQLDTTVPAQDADLRLKILMVNDELPDLISVTDETVISQLVTSGKVWNLEEFLKKYKPDSHLLKDFPEDLKKRNDPTGQSLVCPAFSYQFGRCQSILEAGRILDELSGLQRQQCHHMEHSSFEGVWD